MGKNRRCQRARFGPTVQRPNTVVYLNVTNYKFSFKSFLREFLPSCRRLIDVARVQRATVTFDLTQRLVKLKLADVAQEIPADKRTQDGPVTWRLT